MSHPEQRAFCESIKKKFPEFFVETFVLDIGSLDINGNNRSIFTRPLYIGIDVAVGRNVDVVSPGGDLGLPDETFDVIISTECLEHDLHYDKTLQNACRLLKAGGLLMITCATTGRPEHGTRRTTPQDAPLLQDMAVWSDYYKNLTETDFRAAIPLDEVFEKYDFSVNDRTHDLYFYGIKKGAWRLRKDYSINVAGLELENEMKGRLRRVEEIALAHERSLPDVRNQALRQEISLAEARAQIDHLIATQREEFAKVLSEMRAGIDQVKAELHNAERNCVRSTLIYRLAKPKRIIATWRDKRAGKKGFLSRLAKKIKSTVHELTGYQSKRKITPKDPGAVVSPGLILKDFSSIPILTTPHTEFLARLIAAELKVYGLTSEIIFKRPSNGFSPAPHFVICPQIFEELPSWYVALQMEQSVSSRWFTEDYFSKLRGAFAVFDYSLKNIEFLEKSGLSYKQIYYVPVGLRDDGCSGGEDTQERDIDVLFYGDDQSPRRKAALAYLRERFDVTVVNNVYGEALRGLLRRSKVIINIHYYEGALLETTRIYECLSEGGVIVSEESSDQGEHSILDDVVEFVSVGRFDLMANAVGRLLACSPEILDKRARIRSRRQPLAAAFKYYFGRFLLATDNITFDQFYDRCNGYFELDSDTICLGLPECHERKASFEAENLPTVQYFPGLRHHQGWIGCGLSYKFLARKALDSEVHQIAICEDDVELQSGWAGRYAAALAYLRSLQGEWDIFSGLIANLHEETRIKRVEDVLRERYVHLDKLVSTVFNVYNSRILARLASWDYNYRDVHKNTVDRYLESLPNLDVVTTVPFIFGHKEDLASVLWGFNNSTYRQLIQASEKLLLDKVRVYIADNFPDDSLLFQELNSEM